MKIQIINGPNLNLLGRREKEIYGAESFESYFEKLQSRFKEVNLEYFQSNSEGSIVDRIHQCSNDSRGIVLNAGAYTHTSIVIADAIAAIETPVIEVHISNVYAREKYRHESLIAPKCLGVITGFKLESYQLAVQHFIGEKKS